MAEDKNTALQTKPSAAMAEYDDVVADSGSGRSHIDAEDIRPPRMKLCQSGNPERKPDNPKQIVGLQELDLFNSLTSEIYGREVKFVVVSYLGKTYVEFDQELNVVERDIPPTDPRTKFTLASDGKTRVKPVATTFYNFLLWLTEKQDMVLFSFKSTQIKVAVQLINLMAQPLKIDGNIITMDPPFWAKTYKLTTKMVSDGTYDYGGYNLAQVGITPRELRMEISGLAKSLKDKKIIIEEDDVDDSMAANPEVAPGDASDM